MENLELYNKFRAVPSEAKKEIQGGRLRGMSDINPMWRIKTLTEQFGPCGIGWKYEIKKLWLEESKTNEVPAFAEIALYFKYNGEWSEPIPGVGGSMLVTKEKNGLYTSDECYKMAITDAISVACKGLGVGADVYFEKDRTKYSDAGRPSTPSGKQATSGKQITRDKSQDNTFKCSVCGDPIGQDVKGYSEKKFGKALCRKCQAKQNAAK